MEEVALRKESVDRNSNDPISAGTSHVALRKESVDRNICPTRLRPTVAVALRKESVDRNDAMQIVVVIVYTSLSARRAWIEMTQCRL